MDIVNLLVSWSIVVRGHPGVVKGHGSGSLLTNRLPAVTGRVWLGWGWLFFGAVVAEESDGGVGLGCPDIEHIASPVGKPDAIVSNGSIVCRFPVPYSQITQRKNKVLPTILNIDKNAI